MAHPFVQRIAAVPLLLLTLITVSAQETGRRNILLIVADDMNYECCCSEVTARENRCFSRSSEMNWTRSNRGEFSSVLWD
jgi:hypothetical protein